MSRSPSSPSGWGRDSSYCPGFSSPVSTGPQPLRLVLANRAGKVRHRGVPTVADRVAQRAFLQVCGPQLEAARAEVSFAYRRGRSWVDALARAGRCRAQGLRWVFRTDIADFFGSVEHDLLRCAPCWARSFSAGSGPPHGEADEGCPVGAYPPSASPKVAQAGQVTVEVHHRRGRSVGVNDEYPARRIGDRQRSGVART